MLCLATATHNIKWVKITYICLFWHICKSWGLNTYFIPTNTDRLIRIIRNDNNCAYSAWRVKLFSTENV